MTNEQLAVHILQGGNDELKPILWERIRPLLHQRAESEYYRRRPSFKRCSVEPGDLKQACYEVYLSALKGFKPENPLPFCAYLSFPFKNMANSLLKQRNGRENREPLDNALSLDSPLEGPEIEGLTLADTVPDEQSAEPFERVLDRIEDEKTRSVLSRALGQLEDVQRKVIIMYYFEEMTLRSIGAQLGFTGERASQIRKKALKLLRCMPELAIYRRGQKIEQSFHRITNQNSPGYYEAQRRIAEILSRGDYLTYGEKQAIIYDCKIRAALENNPEYQLYLSLGEDIHTEPK